MEFLNRGFGQRRSRFVSSSTSDLTKTQPVSKLIILQARFQQKQLQEKEEKLLKLYEEQQERAMNRVGSRAQSGGSSVSSTSSSVGRGGKVRHMFQSRRGVSESRQGRDRSYPLEPLKPIRTHSLDVEPSTTKTRRLPGSWSNTSLRARAQLNRNNSDLQLTRVGDYSYGDESDEEDCDRSYGIVRRTQSQVRRGQRTNASKLLYFGGSHTDLRFSDESDFAQTFHVIDDHYEIPDREILRGKDARHSGTDPSPSSSFPYTKEDEYFINNFNDKRQFYENRLRSDSSDRDFAGHAELYQKLPNVGMNRSGTATSDANKASGRYKTFVSQKPFSEKPHLGNGAVPAGRKTITEVGRQTISPPLQNSGAVPPVAKPVRKATPMPASTAPKPHLLQTKRTSVPVRQSPSREQVTPPIPASRTTVGRNPSTVPQGEKPPMTKKTPPRAVKPQNDLPGCQFCGRHFAEDRIGKHEEICRKSSKTKRKPFDSVKQRVKGTEAEQFLKGGKLRGQQHQKTVKVPQKDWRKTHEDFINSIRAAREYQVSTSQVRKPSSAVRPSSSTSIRY